MSVEGAQIPLTPFSYANPQKKKIYPSIPIPGILPLSNSVCHLTIRVFVATVSVFASFSDFTLNGKLNEI